MLNSQLTTDMPNELGYRVCRKCIWPLVLWQR